MTALYTSLVDWYRLLDPLEYHESEIVTYDRALRDAIDGECATLLELGAGAGHNGHFLERRGWRCTLSDLSDAMLALSRQLNPGSEHVIGDMRTLRLGREFDAVLIHDAIVYMLDEDALRAALRTAFVHLRPGGAAIIAPDCLRDSFAERSELHENSQGARALRCVDWMWDPDPSDSTYIVHYAFLLRDGESVSCIHDQHIEGLFDEATWRRLLHEVGFEVTTIARPLDEVDDVTGYTDKIFVARRAVC